MQKSLSVHTGVLLNVNDLCSFGKAFLDTRTGSAVYKGCCC
jgi:hypothetical protein